MHNKIKFWVFIGWLIVKMIWKALTVLVELSNKYGLHNTEKFTFNYKDTLPQLEKNMIISYCQFIYWHTDHFTGLISILFVFSYYSPLLLHDSVEGCEFILGQYIFWKIMTWSKSYPWSWIECVFVRLIQQFSFFKNLLLMAEWDNRPILSSLYPRRAIDFNTWAPAARKLTSHCSCEVSMWVVSVNTDPHF